VISGGRILLLLLLLLLLHCCSESLCAVVDMADVVSGRGKSATAWVGKGGEDVR